MAPALSMHGTTRRGPIARNGWCVPDQDVWVRPGDSNPNILEWNLSTPHHHLPQPLLPRRRLSDRRSLHRCKEGDNKATSSTSLPLLLPPSSLCGMLETWRYFHISLLYLLFASHVISWWYVRDLPCIVSSYFKSLDQRGSSRWGSSTKVIWKILFSSPPWMLLRLFLITAPSIPNYRSFDIFNIWLLVLFIFFLQI